MPESKRGDRILLVLLALATVLLHLPFLGRYGYHGDELYFLSCGARPELGYVDHAPLVPWLAAGADALFADSLLALRALSLLAGAATVALTGLLARALGGGRFAMVLAGLAVMLGPFFLRTANMFSIPSFEPLYWTAASLVLVRLLSENRPQLWLVFGAVAGIGLLNKHTMLLYGFAVAVGLLASRHRRQIGTKWFWLGGAVALALFLPNLLWQAANDWPTWQFGRRLNATTMAGISRPDFLLGQVLYAGVQNALLWLPGLVWLLRDRQGPGRLLGVAYLAVIGTLLILQSKIYYSLPIYPVLFAAGAVFWAQRARRPAARIGLLAFLLALGAAFLPLSMPVLPIEEVDDYAEQVSMGLAGKVHEITGDLHLMFGWEEIAATTAAAYASLDAADRERCVIVTGSYSLAGALERFGPEELPPVLCNHMSWHFWTRRYLAGHRDAARNGDVVLLVARHSRGLEGFYQRVERIAAIAGHPRAMAGFRDLSVYLCREPQAPLADHWPAQPGL